MKIAAIKTISVLGDCLVAFVAARLVGLRAPRWAPVVAGGLVLLLPAVVINGADWGQCDSIYAACALAAILLALRDRTVWAGIVVGVGIAFKLQAVFVLPVLILIVLARNWTAGGFTGARKVAAAAGASAAAYVVMLLPALAAGASIKNLAAVYPNQITSGGVGGGQDRAGAVGTGFGGTPNGLASGGLRSDGGFGGGGFGGGSSGSSAPYTHNAPSFYQWLPSSAPSVWKYLGLALAVLVIVAVGVLVLGHRDRASTDVLLLAAATLAIAIPFLLQSRHERYFYLADILTVVAAFRHTWIWPVAIAVQLGSLAAYAPFLWRTTPIPLGLDAGFELVALLGAGAVLIRRLTVARTVTRAVP